MANLTKATPKKSFRIGFSKFLYAVAIILLIFSSLVIVVPLVSFLLVLVCFLGFIVYFFAILFTLGFILLSEDFRALFGKIADLMSADRFLEFYPVLTTYALYALGAVILISAINLLLIGKNRKTYPGLFWANVVLSIIAFIAFVILLILKITNG